MEVGYMRIAVNTPSAIALLVCMGCALGCGRPETKAPSSHTEFVNLVDTMIDTARQPSKFKACFAEGAVPTDADRLKFEKLIAVTSPEAVVDGDTALFNVSFQDMSGKEIANKEWTAVKVNDEWKLKSVPLP